MSNTEKKVVPIFIISDSAGETATKMVQASLAQYPTIEFVMTRRSFITKIEPLMAALIEAKKVDAMVFHTLINPELSAMANQYCEAEELFHIDLLNPTVSEINRRTGVEPSAEAGALHHLNKNYFDRIKAMEFAVKYDDGKDARGFLKADVVLLGVSRTSKTPLSLYLANKNLKVANLPLIPQAHIPEQLWQVDPKKIVGLTNDPSVLIGIRQERMKAYGLDPETAYSNKDKIQAELDYANELYEKLGCVIINVASLSIEETASMILNALNLEDQSYS